MLKKSKVVQSLIVVIGFLMILQTFETKAAPGDYDASFGVGGVAEHQVSGQTIMSRIALQKDGKILVAGYQPHGQTYLLILRRHHANGSPDLSFGYQGNAVEQLTPNTYRYLLSRSLSEIAVQSDGKILIGGRRHANNGSFLGLSVWRFTNAGILDQTFDGDGRQDVSTSTSTANAYVANVILTKSTTLGGETTKILALCVFPNGAYPYEYRSQISRLNLSGSFDTNFGIGGKITLDGEFRDIAVYKPAQSLSSDLIYAAGADETRTPTLWRFTGSGSPDANFAASGKFVADIGQLPTRNFSKVVVQPDGKILLSGIDANLSITHYMYLLRLLAAGAPDQQFGSTILPNTNISGVYDAGFAQDLGLQSDGKIVSSQQSSFTRYLSNGAGDGSFNLPYGNDPGLFVIQKDDKLISLFDAGFGGTYELRRTLPN